MTNKWILPHVQAEIDALKKFQEARKQKYENEKFLKSKFCPNYVLIDAALWGTNIDMILMDESVTYRSLFRGSTGEELWSVAPYLVSVSDNEELVNKIKKQDPVERRVTWLQSSENIDDLRKHLRRFLRMKREDGSYIYFRFYDPFVVNAVFPNLSQEQVCEFFEKIEYIITEDPRLEEKRIYYTHGQKELQTSII